MANLPEKPPHTACYQCKHSRPFNTPHSVLVGALEDAEQRQWNLTIKHKSMPWWELSRPTESDLDRAGRAITDAMRALKHYDEHVMCTRFPEHVEKENRSYCAEFKTKHTAEFKTKHTAEFSRKSRA